MYEAVVEPPEIKKLIEGRICILNNKEVAVEICSSIESTSILFTVEIFSTWCYSNNLRGVLRNEKVIH